MARGAASPNRIRDAALLLFARHGVAGTSLQMIADELGVTKAAVYHHHRAKADIVAAVLDPAVTSMRDIIDAATAITDEEDAVLHTIAGLADQAVVNRALYRIMLHDPVVSAMFSSQEPFTSLWVRLRQLLSGDDSSMKRRMSVSIFLAGLAGPVQDESLAKISDDELRQGIVHVGTRLLLDTASR